MKRPWGACADCELPYSDDGWADFVVAHDIWAKLTAEDDASLLCANCMVRRATRLEITDATARFTSGPFRALTEQNMTAEQRVLAVRGSHDAPGFEACLRAERKEGGED